MGCSASTVSTEFPEKLTWTRPDFDEVCTKGENSLKLLNELKNGVMSAWDRVLLKIPNKATQPDLLYLGILIGFSQEGHGDFVSIDLHLALTLPGYTKIHINNPELVGLCYAWEEYCNELLGAVPKIHSVQEDIIQTAAVYYQVMLDKEKSSYGNDELDKEVEEAVKQNLKILSEGADFFHQVLTKVIGWTERLCNLFVSIDQEKINQIHALGKVFQGISINSIVDKYQQNLQVLLE